MRKAAAGSLRVARHPAQKAAKTRVSVVGSGCSLHRSRAQFAERCRCSERKGREAVAKSTIQKHQQPLTRHQQGLFFPCFSLHPSPKHKRRFSAPSLTLAVRPPRWMVGRQSSPGIRFYFAQILPVFGFLFPGFFFVRFTPCIHTPSNHRPRGSLLTTMSLCNTFRVTAQPHQTRGNRGEHACEQLEYDACVSLRPGYPEPGTTDSSDACRCDCC